MPRMSPRSIMASSSPPWSNSLRWILSNQRDWPTEISFWIGFIGSPFFFHFPDLSHPLSKPFPTRVIANVARIQERFHQCNRKFGPNHTPTQAQHIHIIVHYTLGGGIGIMGAGCINAFHFVRGNTCADSGATHQNPALRFTILNSSPNFLGHVAVMHGFSAICAHINRLLAGLSYPPGTRIFQRESRM